MLFADMQNTHSERQEPNNSGCATLSFSLLFSAENNDKKKYDEDDGSNNNNCLFALSSFTKPSKL